MEVTETLNNEDMDFSSQQKPHFVKEMPNCIWYSQKNSGWNQIKSVWIDRRWTRMASLLGKEKLFIFTAHTRQA